LKRIFSRLQEVFSGAVALLRQGVSVVIA
jgi:hypothetical protein